jgi:hypothetical protein
MAPRPSGASIAATERLLFASQMGLATRAQVLTSGITSSQARTAVAQGRWVRIGPGIYGLAAWPASDARRILAACLVSGGVASHLSAAWLWGMVTQPPSPPLVCVAHDRRVQSQCGSAGGHGLGAFEVRRSRDLNASSYRYGIPTTNPLRTLVDLAGSAKTDMLDSALDAALASRLVTPNGLLAEASRMERPGRGGPAVIKEHLRQRAFTGAPSPSVLESQALRLLAANGIEVRKCEVVLGEGKYRLDIQLADRLFMEVDGYGYVPELASHAAVTAST